jgi:DNA recombination protein RmuC
MDALTLFLDSLHPLALVVAALVGGAVLAGLVLERRGRALLAEERAARRVAEHGAENAERERAHLEGRLTAAEENLAGLREERARLEAELAAERRASVEKLAAFERAEAMMLERFKAASGDVLKANSEHFLATATQTFEKLREGAKGDLQRGQEKIDALVKPVDEALKQLNAKIEQIELKREGAYSGLKEQVAGLLSTQESLRGETQNLVRALRRPAGRGAWGELHLQRVVEMAGMLNRVDFVEQSHTRDDEGRVLRPDMVVHLPGGQSVIVDAKTPLDAYLDAVNATEEAERARHLLRHARQVREHLNTLGRKSYWQQFKNAPEFVVMFLPMESVFSAALDHDASLIEAGVEVSVIPATPTTLIALLRAVAFGWRQESLAENARAIAEQGTVLYDRIVTFAEHLESVGKGLGGAIGSYNKAIASLETRVLPAARDLRKLDEGGSEKALPETRLIETVPRPLSVLEATSRKTLPRSSGEPPPDEA